MPNDLLFRALHILDLTRIDIAAEDDRAYEIDKWARLFKATTWEELKMIAEQSKFMDDAVVTIAKLSEDEILRQEIEAHEEFLRIKRTQEKVYAMALDKYEKTKAAYEEKSRAYAEKSKAFDEQSKLLDEYKRRYGDIN